MSLASEIPFHTQAWAAFESGGGAEILAQLDLCTHIEVVAAEVAADVIPQLRLGDEDGVFLG